jgi:hypothetical protein
MRLKFGYNIIFNIILENMKLCYKFLWEIFFLFFNLWKENSYMEKIQHIGVNVLTNAIYRKILIL